MRTVLGDSNMSKIARRGGRGLFIPFLSSTASGSRPLSPPAVTPRRSETRRPRIEVADLPWVHQAESPPVDRREFDPLPAFIRPAKRFSGRPARVVAPPPPRALHRPPKGLPARLFSPGGLFFKQPTGVVVCVQRKARREVLFSQGYAGRRNVNRRPGRQGPYSQVRC